MDITNLLIGLFALTFGVYTLYVRGTNPSKFKKLEVMQKAFGDKPGLIVHVIAYSVIPVVAGVLLIFNAI